MCAREIHAAFNIMRARRLTFGGNLLVHCDCAIVCSTLRHIKVAAALAGAFYSAEMFRTAEAPNSILLSIHLLFPS